MYKKIAFFSVVILFLITGFNFIKSPSSPHPKDDSSVFAGEILEFGRKLYSEQDEELIIRDFFNDRQGGVFADIGCADYKDASTTYYLEKHLGWSGIAVDALAEFENGYVENRPKTKFFNFIVTDHSGSKEPFYRLSDSVWQSSTSKEFVESVAEDREDIRNVYQKFYIPTITLTELLEKNGISEIDFLSMDIEGSEPAALAGFDIDKFKPELVCIEAHSNGNKIMRYFTRHGYERIKKYLKYDTQNWYFKPKN